MVYLEDIARVREGFEETNRLASYDGVRSLALEVYRVGEQTPIGVSDAGSDGHILPDGAA